MYINFKSKIFANSIKPNFQDEKVQTHNLEAQFNKFYFNRKNNNRTFNFISLHKTPNNNNIFIQTFLNNKYNSINEKPKLLISSEIKPKNNKKFLNLEKSLNNSYLNTINNFVGNSYEKSLNYMKGQNNNILLTDSNINKNENSYQMKLNDITFKKENNLTES